MILPTHVIPTYANRTLQYSGSDDPQRVISRGKPRNMDGIDKLQHWHAYPHTISYVYNSRGFRDSEWPEQLHTVPVVFGDSFISGLGSPVEHRISNMLGAVNYSMDGASNDWICRRAVDYIQTVKPVYAVVQWSYIHRRELQDWSLPCDSMRRIWYTDATVLEDSDNFVQRVTELESVARANNVDLIHTFIPGIGKGTNTTGGRTSIERASANVIQLVENSVKHCVTFNSILDWARDAHHYDVLTAQQYVALIQQKNF